jgi:hypothetical protein
MGEANEMLIEYQPPEGTKKTMLLPVGLLASDPDEVLRRLKAAGVKWRAGYENHVLQYLIQQSARLSGGQA